MLMQYSYTIKSRTWPVLLAFALIGVPAVFLMIAHPEKKVNTYLFIAAVVFCILFYLLGKTFCIYIDDEILRHSAFGFQKSIRWQDIKSSSLGWSAEGAHGASYNWIFRSFDDKELIIQLGYYSRMDMALLANYVIMKAKKATFCDQVYQMAGGKFPWYLR